MQAAQQFTADQLIVAGRRAEQQGNIAFAIQFYRHLAEAHPASAEAFEARDALYRLAPGMPAAGSALPAPSGNGGGMHANPKVGTLRAEPRAGRPLRGAEPSRAHENAEPAVAGAGGHRVGRFMAAMLSAMGWLLLVAAIAAGPLVVAALTVKSLPKGLRDLVGANLLVFGGGAAACLLLGLIAIAAGQMARAMFDTADLTRWLADTLSAGRGEPHR
jgi:hypothetical protein